MFGRPLRHDSAAAIATLWSHIDHPICCLDDIQIVLDHNNRVAGIDKLIQHAKQQRDVMEVQTRRGLVQNIKRATGAAS